MTQPDIHEALFRAESTRETGLRLKPQIQRHDIDVIAAVERATGNLRRLHAPVAAQILHTR